MFYGTPTIHRDNDSTDLVGLRTLVLSQTWVPSSGALSQEQIDAEQPDIPGVSGGVLLVGEQTLQERGKMRTRWTFQGIKGNGKTVTFRDRSNSLDYQFDPSFAQVSIQRHPNFLNLIKTYGGQPSNDGQSVIWPTIYAASSNGLTASGTSQTNPMFGIQDYFRLEGTYRFRYLSLALPSGILSPAQIVPSAPGQPPPLQDGRNWLKLPVQYRRRGLIFEIIEQYWLSGPGGWPLPVYNQDSNSGFGANTSNFGANTTNFGTAS